MFTSPEVPVNEASPDPSSRSPEEVARASLHHARQYCANVDTALGRVVQLLRGSRVPEATELYTQTLDALNVLVFVLTAAAAQLGDESEPLLAIEEDSAGWLAELEQAQELDDWTALADCLEYEVATRVNGWRERVDVLLGAPS